MIWIGHLIDVIVWWQRPVGIQPNISSTAFFLPSCPLCHCIPVSLVLITSSSTILPLHCCYTKYPNIERWFTIFHSSPLHCFAHHQVIHSDFPFSFIHSPLSSTWWHFLLLPEGDCLRMKKRDRNENESAVCEALVNGWDGWILLFYSLFFLNANSVLG